MSEPDQLLLLDTLARRYGRLPHEILALSPFEITLAWQAYQQARSTLANQIDRSGGMIFPVVDLGG